ncbi:MAG: luciferase [Halobacteriales archaeon]
MLKSQGDITETGLDAVALKPTECCLEDAVDLPIDRVTIDYEGGDNLPTRETLDRLAKSLDVRVTTPVRAGGFDPLGDDQAFDRLPKSVGVIAVAGHPAYLDENERKRAIGPRLGPVIDRYPDAWVGTEGIERLALATGTTQFELLSRRTERAVGSLRSAGFDGSIAVYAPTVPTNDADRILDAVGEYVARRGPIRRALPEDAEIDSDATGQARSVLLDGADDYALVGELAVIRDRVSALKSAGVDTVVGYPAAGLESFLQ